MLSTRRRLRTATAHACVLLFGMILAAHGAWAGFGKDWRSQENLKALGAEGVEDTLVLVDLNRPAGLYHPGEAVRIALRAPTDGVVPGAGWRIEALGFNTGEYDPTETGFVVLDKGRAIALSGGPAARTPLDAAEREGEVLRLTVAVPDRYGMYALLLRRPDGRKTVLAGIARIMKPAPRIGDIPQIMCEWGLSGRPSWRSHHTQDQVAEALARLGMGLVRREFPTGVAPVGHETLESGRHGVEGWDAFFRACEAHGIRVVATMGAHQEDQLRWKHRGRVLTRILPPSRDPELQQWLTNFCARYWRDGSAGLWGLEHWNEPWEPSGISGWNADSRRYRQLLTVIHGAARAVDQRLKVVASSSIMNTEDKFLSGESRAHIRMLDILSDHYVSLPNAYGPRVAEKHGLLSGETETWGVHSQVLALQFMTQFLSAGQRFINPTQASMLWTESGVDPTAPEPRHKKKDFQAPGLATPMPAAVTFAAWNAIIRDRPFRRLAFTDHLPYLYQFGPDGDARFVLVGKLTTTGSGNLKDYPWSQVLEGPNGVLRIADPDGVLTIRDFAGNRVAPDAAGNYEIPMSTQSFFVWSDEGAGAVVEAVRRAAIEGLRWIHIAPGGLPAPPSAENPVDLPVRIHNARNAPLSATLTVVSLLDGEPLGDAVPFEAAPGETAVVRVPIRSAPAGGLPLRFSVHPEGAPPETWKEVVPMTGVTRATLPVTGDPATWDAVPAVTVRRPEGEAATDVIDRIWLPFLKHEEGTLPARQGEVKLAWDEEHLYLYGAIDGGEIQAKQRLGAWDEEGYFWSEEKADIYAPLAPWARFVKVHPRDHKAMREIRDDPSYPKYQAFLEEHPELAKLAREWKTRLYFHVKAEHPDASLDEIGYVYHHGFIGDLPFSGDTFQFAFDTDAPADYMTATHDLDYPHESIPRGWTAVPDSDHEFSVYLCDDGAPEVWRLLGPGIPRGHHFPRAEKNTVRQRPVPTGASVAVRGDRIVYRVALPWSALGVEDPKPGMDFGFTFRFNTSGGRGEVAFGEDLGATKSNGLTLHPYWKPSPGNTVRWVLLGP